MYMMQLESHLHVISMISHEYHGTLRRFCCDERVDTETHVVGTLN